MLRVKGADTLLPIGDAPRASALNVGHAPTARPRRRRATARTCNPTAMMGLVGLVGLAAGHELVERGADGKVLLRL